MNFGMNVVLAGLAIGSLGAVSTPAMAAEKAVLQSRVSAAESVGFDVYLPLQHRDQLETDLRAMHDSGSASYRKWLTPAQFNARYAATPAQVAAVQQQLAAYDLQSTVVNAHHIHVAGSALAVEQALGTVLKHGTYANGQHTVAAAAPITSPAALAQINAVITGLSGEIRMRAHSHPVALPENRYSATGPYWFDDLKQAYSFPSVKKFDGAGVTIGILMTGAFNPPDMDQYFSHEKIATPSFSTVNVDGGAPYNPNGGSFETHLDLQQSGGMAPKAKVVLYNIPDLSDASIMDGLSQIITDNKADVVSMSFGGPELFYTAEYNGGTDFTNVLQQEDDLMAQGNAQGITFIASSGDTGALTAPPLVCFNFGPDCGAMRPSASFPASSPHVTGVGGTNLVTTHTSSTDLNSAYVREEAYGDPLAGDLDYGTSSTGNFWASGGGDSIVFSKPLYQRLVKTGNKSFRTVPDLALHMGGCPNGVVGTCNPDDSADIEVLGGKLLGVIGTSASAPDFAGLTALNIQRFGSRMGNENYYIYALAALQNLGLQINVFKTGVLGFNGLYTATGKGYNRVIGNGTLNGVNFMLAPFTPVAGTPQTPTNP